MTTPLPSTLARPDGILHIAWHSGSTRTRWTLALGCTAAAIGIGCIATNVELWVACIVFALGALGVLAEQETCINVATGVIHKEIRLFGIVVLSSSLPLSDFVAVDSARTRGSGQADPLDQVFVGLRSATGRLLRLRYFSVPRGQPSAAADEFGRKLADETALEWRSEGRNNTHWSA